MKTLLYIYILGAVLTKIAIRNTPADNNRLVAEWPLVWWNDPGDMSALLLSRFKVDNGPAYPGPDIAYPRVDAQTQQIFYPPEKLPPLYPSGACNCR
jgi:hypothetical protein